MTLQTYLLASLSNTDAWNNQFLTLLSDRGIHVINANSRREESPPPPSLVLFEQIPIAPDLFFWSNAASFPLCTLIFGPAGLHSKPVALRNLPARYADPVYAVGPAVPPRPPSFTCRGAAALILAPCLLPRRLAQTSSPSGLAQQAAACPSSDSDAAELCQKGLPWHTEQWSGRVYRLEEKKNKKQNPTQTLPLIAPESSRQAQPRTLKCAVYFPRTAFPFSDMNSLPSNHQASQLPIQGSQSPGGKAHPSPDTNHWLILCARGNSVQPKNSHLILPSLFSLCCPNTPW